MTTPTSNVGTPTTARRVLVRLSKKESRRNIQARLRCRLTSGAPAQGYLLARRVPNMAYSVAASARLAQRKEHQSKELAVTGSTPVPPPSWLQTNPRARKRPPSSPRKAGASMIGRPLARFELPVCEPWFGFAGRGIKRGDKKRPLAAAPTSAL